jgi:hypothetical protein
MKSADWIVADYLKRILENASIGRAFLESKQKYIGYYTAKGRSLDAMGEKTLIEYVLFGDPSIHPVGRMVSGPERALAAEERRQRRAVLARRAEQVCKLLPIRTPATRVAPAMAKKVFNSARRALWKADIKELEKFGIKPTAARVEKLVTPLHIEGEARSGPGIIQNRQSLEYYWGGKRVRDRHTQTCLIKAETDLKSNVYRTAVAYSS